MTNICIIAFADGRVESRKIADWPDFTEIQKLSGVCLRRHTIISSWNLTAVGAQGKASNVPWCTATKAGFSRNFHRNRVTLL